MISRVQLYESLLNTHVLTLVVAADDAVDVTVAVVLSTVEAGMPR